MGRDLNEQETAVRRKEVLAERMNLARVREGKEVGMRRTQLDAGRN